MTPAKSWLLVGCFVLAPSIFVALLVRFKWDYYARRKIILDSLRQQLARQYVRRIYAEAKR
jgi:hypothetical protein